MEKKKAATYLRSSKDRSDVSIDAQRRELQSLASSRGLEIVHEYADVVQSAKTADRPDFQRLLLDLRDSRRGWSTLLTVDTSRLSRRRYWAQAFKHEAAKRGVAILYSKVPDVDPITQVILESVLEAMDEVHSLMSREKGLAGMAENVRRGYRAGGRAPRGYRLVHFDTNAIRDGKAVQKSKLEPDELAPAVRTYLAARAAGRPRAAIKKALGLPDTTLVGMEWQALTYAGFTVWGMHCEKSAEGGYVGGRKRRPRGEWMISDSPTHEALISRAEAEAILIRLETSPIGARVSEGRRGVSAPLLTEYLVTSDGRRWTADRKYYRLGSCFVRQDSIDGSVLEQIERNMKSPESIRALIREAQREQRVDVGPARSRVNALTEQIRRTVDLAAQLEDPAPAARRIEQLERERTAAVDELADLEAEQASRTALAAIGPQEITAIITESEPKRLLEAVVDRVRLDPDLRGQVVYRLSMASPGRAEGSPITVAAPFEASAIRGR
jgi:DNA invertase Pin-like site-specific DNA recombinase